MARYPRGGPPASRPPGPGSLAQVVARAEALAARGEREAAIRLYRHWLRQSRSPLAWAVQANLGLLLRQGGDLPGAVAAYRAALAARPDYPNARVNLGFALELLDRPLEALREWRAALALLDADPAADRGLRCTLLNNLGRRLERDGDLPAAEEHLTRSLRLDCSQEAALYHRITLRQKLCRWPVYDPLPGLAPEAQVRATSAVAMLGVSDDPELQLRAALGWNREALREARSLAAAPGLAPAAGYRHGRLRIGYLSSNFGMHAVSALTAELFELHDRNRVEVWGFCGSPEDGSVQRQRIIQAMDHFVPVGGLPDPDAARAVRAAEIDVLVDLQGLTEGYRPGLLARRPAPVQVTYLGFPGPTGLPGVDYVLADRFVLPEATAPFYPERPLYLEGCFQVNDRRREAAPPRGRGDYGLPEPGFVFCCFNNPSKITQETFDSWLRILQRCPGSVLWLYADPGGAREHLAAHAAARGVGAERLVFAGRMPVAEYLGCYRAADLFLDTFPFNAGTTASEALWMGLPILTRCGRSFASRMGGSLLRAAGLPDLVTQAPGEYEDLAAALARDPERLGALRARLAPVRAGAAPFDTPAQARRIEDLLFAAAASRA